MDFIDLRASRNGGTKQFVSIDEGGLEKVKWVKASKVPGGNPRVTHGIRGTTEGRSFYKFVSAETWQTLPYPEVTIEK